jgi:hypothetical protein
MIDVFEADFRQKEARFRSRQSLLDNLVNLVG